MNQKTIKKYSSLAFKKYRKKYGLFLAEGYHLVEELLKSDWTIHLVMTSNSKTFDMLGKKRKIPEIELVKPEIIKKVANASTPQDILAIVRMPEVRIDDFSPHNRIILADGIKDPGNMGTIIRTARAFGFTALATTPTSTDVFSPKVIRATQGALFGIEIFESVSIGLVRDKLKSTHKLYALDPLGATVMDDIEPVDRSVLVVGSEIGGIDRALLDLADYRVRIPHSATVESLNAAVAGGIAMHRFRAKS